MLGNTRVFRWFVLAVAALAASTAARAPAAEERWEYLPYRVRVLTAVAPQCRLGADFENELRRTLVGRAETQLGGAWILQCAAAPAELTSAALTGLEQMTAEAFQKAAGAECDKFMLVVVDAGRAGHRVRAREFDVATRLLGQTVERSARQPALIATVAADTLFAAFTPLARVQMPRTGEVVIRVRASRLLPNESSPGAAPPQSLFRPFLPVKPKEGEEATAALAPIPWTYVEVTKAVEGRLSGRLISGSAEALPAESRQERLAAMVKSVEKSTEVRLITRDTSPEGQPLVGYELSERTLPDGAIVPLGETNAAGALVIAANAERLRDVYVTSGRVTLARVPLVPGYLPEETLVLADDGPRREAEGFLRAFEGRVLDLVAQRTELAQRAKRRLAEGKRGEAEALAKQARALGSKEPLLTALEAARRRISPKQGAVREQVEKMFIDARDELNFHLSKNPLDEVPGLGGAAAP